MKKLNLFLVAAAFLGSYLYLPYLPANIPMHWNLIGEVDNYMPKQIGAWIIPFMALFVFILYQFLPLLDPKKSNYRSFKNEWHIIQTSIIAFLVYMQFLIFYIAIHPSVTLLPALFIGLGIMFIIVGMMMPKIKQNFFIGIRSPWTLTNEQNWDKTHRFGKWCFVGFGIVILFEGIINWYSPVVIFSGAMLMVALPNIYSFLLFKKSPLLKR